MVTILYARYSYNFVKIEIYSCNRFLKINISPFLHIKTFLTEYRWEQFLVTYSPFALPRTDLNSSDQWIIDLWFIRLLCDAKDIYLSSCNIIFFFDFFSIPWNSFRYLQRANARNKIFANYICLQEKNLC